MCGLVIKNNAKNRIRPNFFELRQEVVVSFSVFADSTGTISSHEEYLFMQNISQNYYFELEL